VHPLVEIIGAIIALDNDGLATTTAIGGSARDVIHAADRRVVEEMRVTTGAVHRDTKGVALHGVLLA